MFISFTVKNFKTFNQETFFSMEREGQYRKVKNYINYYLEGRKKRENRLQLLKSALVLGNHQCGKTTLIEAILAMKSLVLDQQLIYLPYAYNHEPIMMAMEYIYHEQLYRYVVSYDESHLLLESLERMDIKTQEYTTLFAEDQLHSKPNILSYEAAGFFKSIQLLSEQTIDHQLWKLKDEQQHRLILSALRYLGFDINDLTIQDKMIDGKIVSELMVYHSFSNQLAIPIQEENIGLQKVLRLLLTLLFNKEDAFYLIDNLEEGLYSEVAQRLIMMMNTLDNESQYMITTRLPQLMDAGLSKDQIYILDHCDHNLFLSSLAEEEELFSVRQNQRYSEGHFINIVSQKDWHTFIETEF